MDIYTALARPLIFSGLKLDPEQTHQQALQWLNRLNAPEPGVGIRWVRRRFNDTFALSDPRLEQCLWNLTFPNPVGLAAGFDKDGLAASVWPDFGFGFAEVGTVTWHAQPGNPKPRLFRLLSDQAVLNRMGFNNQGAEALAQRLAVHTSCRSTANTQSPQRRHPLGINLGKSKITPLDEAATDYGSSFEVLKTLGDYFVVNVSSPNTPGLRSLQSTEQLKPILETLQTANGDKRPLLVKIAPDLAEEDIVAVVDLARDYHLAGIIATNTTIQRSNLRTEMLTTGNNVADEPGGISGKPLGDRSTEVIRLIYNHTQGQLPIIGVGGVFTAEDAWNKITAGASLIQIYTGWIYEGPWMVKRILAGLLQTMEAQGLSHLSEAIGFHAGVHRGSSS